ncbi:hypothetical protein A35E_00466 [secondary endosymbiont of Heteropsylla cubana]|uniref:HTH cro/C1-type domain-containing protein n=1 Tax=secondary endosymbiont of Heteropsylla cubana TaxID=134287 RepID=J3YTH3_9ENTR|nr:helix-turn-helix domain-containing protein [secondary endosymbiont of Heteropsylla cubana]AFP85758.1 hypothetical protein A35E_00466 [secondary endosymbiont of Heteropsylla cubana]
MKTEVLQDTPPITTGGRLRRAREGMGLSQQVIAERLCLKLSTIRDIEDDQVNPNLSTTFLRGYIRSYARLVHLSEEELTPIITKQYPIQLSKIEPRKCFLFRKTTRKHENWLMNFIWIVLFIVICFMASWWLKNYQEQPDTANITTQSSCYFVEIKSCQQSQEQMI